MGMAGASPVAWSGGPTAADIMEGPIAVMADIMEPIAVMEGPIMERRRGMGAVAIEHCRWRGVA
jgi:hypothetical protein